MFNLVFIVLLVETRLVGRSLPVTSAHGAKQQLQLKLQERERMKEEKRRLEQQRLDAISHSAPSLHNLLFIPPPGGIMFSPWLLDQ